MASIISRENDLKILCKRSIVQSLFRRELSNFNSLDRFSNVVQRQLIKSRGQSVKIKAQPQNDYTTFMEINALPSVSTSVIVISDRLFIRRHQKNEPYRCVQLPKHIKLPEKSTIQSFLKYEKYKIPTVERWTDWELFYSSTPNPNPIVFKQRIPITLFILEKNSPVLKLYDFDSGVLLQKLFIDPVIKFKNIERCGFECTKFMLQSSKSTLPKGILSEFIVLNYAPLEIYSRCRVFTSAFPKATELMVAEKLIFVIYASNCIEICDFQDIFESAVNGYKVAGVNNTLGNVSCIGVTHSVQKKLPVLIKIENCFTGALEINSWGNSRNPPWCISKTKNRIFKVFTTNGDQLRNSRLINFVDFAEGENFLEFHHDDSGRLILSGRNEIRVMKIERDQENSSVFVEFQRKFHGSSKARYLHNADDNNRKSLRSGSSVTYCDEEEVEIKWKYDPNMDVLVVMKIAQSSLQFFLFDNQEWYTITVIEPLQFKLPNIKNRTFFLPTSDFDLTETFIILTLGKSHEATEKVILVDMLGEEVVERCNDRTQQI